MTEDRYGKYFFEKPIVDGRFASRLVFFSKNYVGEKDFSLLWNCVTEPFLMVEEAHSHDFDQFLHFYGGDSRNIADFDAEVELSLGEGHDPPHDLLPLAVGRVGLSRDDELHGTGGVVQDAPQPIDVGP